MVEMETARVVEFVDTSGQHPHAPIGPHCTLPAPIEMDEAVLQQIARHADRMPTREERRAADRENHLSNRRSTLRPG